jgi:predicted amidohydrolase YtcJ
MPNIPIRIHVLRLVALALFPPAAVAASPAIEPADLVFRGSAILTMDSATPRAQAVAVRAGRIVFVGAARGVDAYVGAHTHVMDLGSRLLMPAFHDVHVHPMSGGMRLLRCALDETKSVQAVGEAIRACDRNLPAATWLIVGGLSEFLLHDPALDRRALDRLVPMRPLAVSTTSGFALRANSAALALAEFEDSAAGVERDATTGEPTGLVSGDAVMGIRHLWPRPTAQEYRRALQASSDILHRYGIVSVLDASVEPALLAAYREADAAGELSLRVVAAQRIDPQKGVAQIESMRAGADAVHSRRLRADAAKIFVDGEIGEHTALLLAPYADAPTSGKPLLDLALLNQLVEHLDSAGFDLHLHVMGDGAVHAGLDAIALAIQHNGPRDRRDQLAHDQVIDPADIRRFATLGVIANVQPTWAWHDPVNRDAELRLGAQRARYLVPIRSLIDAKAHIVAGSDGPGPSMNPLDAIQIAITRRPLDGAESTWHPEQCADLMPMLRAYTSEAAWALRLENESGSIAVGKAADLIVLDRDLRKVKPMELHNVRVVLTLLEGSTVYADEALKDQWKN